MASDYESWEIPLACPFCGAVIVLVRDHDNLPADMPEDEAEEIRCTEKGWDDCDGDCEHLAFWSDWAFVGSDTRGDWDGELIALARGILQAQGDSTEPEHMEVVAVLANALYDDNPDLATIAAHVVPDYEFASVRKQVSKGGDWGPRYMLIFFRKRA